MSLSLKQAEKCYKEYMEHKLTKPRKSRKPAKFLSAAERYALAAIYGPGWPNMTRQALEAALKIIREK